jgi:hypothetical protein
MEMLLALVAFLAVDIVALEFASAAASHAFAPRPRDHRQARRADVRLVRRRWI